MAEGRRSPSWRLHDEFTRTNGDAVLTRGHGTRDVPAVAVTGLGAVSACGWGVEPLWRSLSRGETTVGEPREFKTSDQRTRLVAEVEPPAAAWRRLFAEDSTITRADGFALFAAREAMAQAGLDLPAPGLGVFFGGSTAGMAEAEAFYGHLVEEQAGGARLRLVAGHQINSPGDAVARHVGAMGPVVTLSSACASGALAFGAALDALRAGEVEMALAGGSDSLCRLTYAGFNSLRAVDGEPCRPFRQQRQGLSMGEGAGVVVLETPQHALGRRAPILGWLLGAGSSCDAHHMTAPHPQGRGAAEAISNALLDGSVAPSAVSFINAHGTGTPHNDISEWRAIESVFGQHAERLPVTSTKGIIGHLLGSSGAIEAVATLLCLQHRAVHPTPGDGDIDALMEVDLVTDVPRNIAADSRAVSTSFAFGGSNAALVFASAEAKAEGRR